MSSNPKRYFPPVWIVGNATATAAAVFRLWRPGALPRTAVLGQLLAHGAVSAILLRILFTRSSTLSRNFPGYQAVGVGGTLLLAAHGRTARRATWRAALLAVGGNAVYTGWYAHLKREPSEALIIGHRIPNVTFLDEQGRPVTTESLRGRPTVFMFLRGNWCPVCMAQAKEMAVRYRELEAAGVQVALIAAQDQEHTRHLSERFGVSFRYLHDPGLQASRVLGVVHAGGRPAGVPGYDADTLFPTVVITDADGEIVFCHQTDNYRIRPTPELIFEVLGRTQRTHPAPSSPAGRATPQRARSGPA